MKILVTGGAGFIGSWLVDFLLDAGHSVVVIDNLSSQIHGSRPNITAPWILEDKPVSFIREDIRNRDALEQALSGVDAVVHLAAETGTGQSMYQIARYNDVNQQATATLLELISGKCRSVKKLILASSRSIYGEGAYRLGDQIIVPSPRSAAEMQRGNFDPTGPRKEKITAIATPEDIPPAPASIYASTKLFNEISGKIISEICDCQVIALRFQNVYGERQSLQNPYTGLISIFSNRMRQGLPINIFEDGQESRDFVHVSDVVRAIVLALNANSKKWLVVNVGSGVAVSVYEVAKKLKDLLRSKSTLNITGDFRLGDIRHCYADLSRARHVLKFSPNILLPEGLERFAKWVVTQPIFEDKTIATLNQMRQLGLARFPSK